MISRRSTVSGKALGQHEPPPKALIGRHRARPSSIPSGRHYSIPITAGEVEQGKAGPQSSFVIGWHPEFPVAGCPATRPECGSVLRTDHPTAGCRTSGVSCRFSRSSRAGRTPGGRLTAQPGDYRELDIPSYGTVWQPRIAAAGLSLGLVLPVNDGERDLYALRNLSDEAHAIIVRRCADSRD